MYVLVGGGNGTRILSMQGQKDITFCDIWLFFQEKKETKINKSSVKIDS